MDNLHNTKLTYQSM